MEQLNHLICFIHMGGELVWVGDTNVEYKGRVRDVLSIDCCMTYKEFTIMACHLLNIPPNNLTFTYTLAYDLLASMPLRNDHDFINFLDTTTSLPGLYISRTPPSEVVECCHHKIGLVFL